ncbi:hypothetical protein HPB47_007744 [Ixodes persulcatus]|uniref:Uncharacterized protein n=1 Tax=Ixodes persulcatus TaxID=34615 RepID=A0AC60P6L1_IXOPE|nr:hypothetical protein HPB47_007744 [Ixodes persulcatus]
MTISVFRFFHLNVKVKPIHLSSTRPKCRERKQVKRSSTAPRISHSTVQPLVKCAMAGFDDVGIGDFVLLENINTDAFMDNLKLRQYRIPPMGGRTLGCFPHVTGIEMVPIVRLYG